MRDVSMLNEQEKDTKTCFNGWHDLKCILREMFEIVTTSKVLFGAIGK